MKKTLNSNRHLLSERKLISWNNVIVPDSLFIMKCCSITISWEKDEDQKKKNKIKEHLTKINNLKLISYKNKIKQTKLINPFLKY